MASYDYVYNSDFEDKFEEWWDMIQSDDDDDSDVSMSEKMDKLDSIPFDVLDRKEAKRAFDLTDPELVNIKTYTCGRYIMYDPKELEAKAIQKFGKENYENKKRQEEEKKRQEAEKENQEAEKENQEREAALKQKQRKDPKRKELNEALMGNRFCLEENGKHLGHVTFEKKTRDDEKLRIVNGNDDTLWLDELILAMKCRLMETSSSMWDEWLSFETSFRLCGEYVRGVFEVKVNDSAGTEILGSYEPQRYCGSEWTAHKFKLVPRCTECKENED